MKEPNVVQGLLQAAFTAVGRNRAAKGRELRARQSRALIVVSSSSYTRRRKQTVTYIVSRGPRRMIDENSRQVILVHRQLVGVRHVRVDVQIRVYSEVLRCKH